MHGKDKPSLEHWNALLGYIRVCFERKENYPGATRAIRQIIIEGAPTDLLRALKELLRSYTHIPEVTYLICSLASDSSYDVSVLFLDFLVRHLRQKWAVAGLVGVAGSNFGASSERASILVIENLEMPGVVTSFFNVLMSGAGVIPQHTFDFLVRNIRNPVVRAMFVYLVIDTESKFSKKAITALRENVSTPGVIESLAVLANYKREILGFLRKICKKLGKPVPEIESIPKSDINPKDVVHGIILEEKIRSIAGQIQGLMSHSSCDAPTATTVASSEATTTTAVAKDKDEGSSDLLEYTQDFETSDSGNVHEAQKVEFGFWRSIEAEVDIPGVDESDVASTSKTIERLVELRLKEAREDGVGSNFESNHEFELVSHLKESIRDMASYHESTLRGGYSLINANQVSCENSFSCYSLSASTLHDVASDLIGLLNMGIYV